MTKYLDTRNYPNVIYPKTRYSRKPSIKNTEEYDQLSYSKNLLCENIKYSINCY